MIEAAGGVVLRTHEGREQVLVVHRTAYDDWSLPKGKLDPGETHEIAAVREIEEETGTVTQVGPELPELYYDTDAGPKHVRWFLMRWISGDPAQRPPDSEVDIVRWVDTEEADTLLTYDHDRELLTVALVGELS